MPSNKSDKRNQNIGQNNWKEKLPPVGMGKKAVKNCLPTNNPAPGKGGKRR